MLQMYTTVSNALEYVYKSQFAQIMKLISIMRGPDMHSSSLSQYLQPWLMYHFHPWYIYLHLRYLTEVMINFSALVITEYNLIISI